MAQHHPERRLRHLQMLYTVVAGLALTVAVTALIDKEQQVPIRSSLLPYFVAYLFTLVPFYHGALRHLDATYIEDNETDVRPGALMVDWSLLFIESCILLAIASLLQNSEAFSYSLVCLFVFDMVWGFGAHLAFSPKSVKLRPEVRWAIINLFTAGALVAVLVFLDSLDPTKKPVSTYRWILILTISIVRTIGDYYWCWSYYYPSGETAK